MIIKCLNDNRNYVFVNNGRMDEHNGNVGYFKRMFDWSPLYWVSNDNLWTIFVGVFLYNLILHKKDRIGDV